MFENCCLGLFSDTLQIKQLFGSFINNIFLTKLPQIGEYG